MSETDKPRQNWNPFRKIFQKKDISSNYRWSILILKENQLMYEMLSNNAVKMLGYFMINYGRSKKDPFPWKLFLRFNKNGKDIQLVKTYFPNSDNINEELFDKIEQIDPNYKVTSHSEIIFIDRIENKNLPLNSGFNLSIESILNETDNEVKTFFDVLDILFVKD